MKFLAQLILIALLTFLGQYILPWWGLFITAGLVGVGIKTKGFSTFLAGFIAVAGLWFLQIYLIDAANDSILSTKISAIFTLSTPMQLILVSSLIGGICGGFAALTGKLFADIFKKKKEQHSVYS
jgi:hypothetical protein